ncbi:MAG: hypothetical protein WCY23_01570 [Candidatus Omnitrophota bacterium]
MKSKTFLLTVALTLSVAFLFGIFGILAGWSVLASWACTLVLFIETVTYFASRKAFKSIIAWIIAIIVIAALSIAGGCGLTFLGISLGGGFMR